MIHRVRLLHYLQEDTYRRICSRFDLHFELANSDENRMTFLGRPITEIKPFHIAYRVFGHIWFLYADVDFPAFQCSYQDFPARLFEEYGRLFGGEIMKGFPPYEQINCDYIEYCGRIEVRDAPEEMQALKSKGCPPEQLDKALWNTYRKPHGTIECCFAPTDDGAIEIQARCHGTALKARIRDSKCHIATGVLPAAAVNGQTEAEIMDWLCEKYGLPSSFS